MAEALLGAPLLSSTAGASTVGLIGAGGQLSLGAGTLFSSSSLLSVGLTAASAFSDIGAGNSIAEQQVKLAQLQSQQSLFQSKQSELSARQETLRGRQEALEIKRRLSRNLSSQNAIFAARGVLDGEGTAEAAMKESEAAATRDIDVAMFSSTQRANAELANSTAQRADASNRVVQGNLSATSSRNKGFSSAVSTISTSLLDNL